MTALRERLFVWLQYVLPQHTLSRLIHRLARVRQRWFRDRFINVFVRLFAVEMGEAQEPDLSAYETFNAFFTRALRPGARPMPGSPEALACPVDGTVSQAGRVREEMLLQAKDRRYRLVDLLGDADWAQRLAGGSFLTVYLAPYNYHRIHMPVAGRLRRMIHIPGRLFSVNAATVRSVPRLFARNERVVCLFDTAVGPMAQVLVGALNVGSIETVWAGEVTPGRPRQTGIWDYGDDLAFERGAEMGRFNMGSTVITVFAQDRVMLSDRLLPGRTVQVGQSIGAPAATGLPSSSEAI